MRGTRNHRTTSMKTLRIATRQSPLALWQAKHVRAELSRHHPALALELVPMTTQGDRMLSAPLAAVGGKGLFLKELEDGLLNGKADIAVHSMKDVTVNLPPGLHLAVMCERADATDAFVSNHHPRLQDLPERARVGTSSLRRGCQLKHAFPHLEILPLRGNVNTRLAKLDDGHYDAIILAAAGLRRLGFDDRIRHEIDVDTSLPAVGQGVMGIECREDDDWVNELLQPLNHEPSTLCVRAERAMNADLEGGCQVPIAGFARIQGGRLELRGLVGDPDGSRVLRASASGEAHLPDSVGAAVAKDLISQGAREILRAVYSAS